MNVRLAVAGMLAGALLLSACGKPAAVDGGGEEVKEGEAITVGYTQQGAAYSDLYTCIDQGVFEKNGIKVEITRLNSSSQLLAALSSGSVNIGVGLAESTAVGALKGVDIKYLANPIPKYYMEMWGKKDIKSVEDLKGKMVAVSSPGSQSDVATRTMLEDHGLTDKDVELQYLKSVPAEITALEKGAVDAMVSQPPNGTKTGEHGFHKILDFTDYPAVANAYTVTGGFLEKHRKDVAAFVKSQVTCTSILKQQKEDSIASIRKHSGTDDEALAEYAWTFFKDLWAEKPLVDEKLLLKSFENAAEKQKTDPPTDVSKYIDNSFVEELDESGYIDSLYKG